MDGKRIKLQIWDTAGQVRTVAFLHVRRDAGARELMHVLTATHPCIQERFKTITTAYYRGAMGILLVYDVTNEASFTNINQWMLAIRQHASSSVNKVLLGNKADTSGPLVSKRAVATARGQALADQHGIRFFETSAKNSINIEEAFSTVTRDIKQRLLDGDKADEAPSGGSGNTLKLSDARQPATKKGCC